MSAESNQAPKENILVVDDTPANLRLLSSMLADQGYKVRSVINGAMALTAAQAAPPDLILLDINMPEMNGYQVCEKLKAHAETRDIPIIFISALGETKDKIQAFTVGGVDYVTKPFQIEEVLARVQTHIALRNLQRQLQRTNGELEKRVQERTAELVRLNAALERFVPREFVNYLQKNSIAEVQLGDQVQAEMTILFADIRNFTTRAEQMVPQDCFNFLNAYLSQVSPIIRVHHGFIDKYLGDGIMALFPGTADDAVQAAIDMQCEVARYNAQMSAQGLEPVRIGIGLHTGTVMMGIIGEAERLQGTVIADAVNLAGRLEQLTKVYGAPVIISEQTLKHLHDPDRYHHRFLGRARVKGKLQMVSIFEAFDGDPAPTIQLKLKTRPELEEGLSLYYARKFPEASVKFNHVLQQNPQDETARLYLQRAAYYLVHGVPPDWTGDESPTDGEGEAWV